MRRPILAIAGKILTVGRDHRDLILRLLVALPGGYSLAGLGGVCLSLWLPLSRADDAMAGILFGLVIWPVVFIVSFGLSSVRRLLAGLAGGLLVLALLTIESGWRP
ncbi:hypothetical protein AA101099_1826 [Neoasaia chiangmaiensis NBRC 101099]|nr:hypothetical protein AA101099_1826 [Neoasaia chiangmaiensis NBRC 101099]